MREILFRGKCINTGNWVHGCLVNNMFTYSEHSEFKKGEKVCEIITGDYESDNWEEAIQEENNLVKVIPESVGQFTGLTDKNGNKIFEFDVFDVGQTINGQSRFVIVNCIGGYDVRYEHDLSCKYQYDVKELLGIEELELTDCIVNNRELLK